MMDFFDIQLVYSLKDKIGMYDLDLTTEELEALRSSLTVRLLRVKQERIYMNEKDIQTCKEVLKKVEELLAA